MQGEEDPGLLVHAEKPACQNIEAYIGGGDVSNKLPRQLEVLWQETAKAVCQHCSPLHWHVSTQSALRFFSSRHYLMHWQWLDRVSVLLFIWQVRCYLERAHRASAATPVAICVSFCAKPFWIGVKPKVHEDIELQLQSLVSERDSV